MDPAEMLALADNWMGEGMELARRVLAYAERVEAGLVDLDSRGVTEDIRQIMAKEWNPCDKPSRPAAG